MQLAFHFLTIKGFKRRPFLYFVDTLLNTYISKPHGLMALMAVMTLSDYIKRSVCVCVCACVINFWNCIIVSLGERGGHGVLLGISSHPLGINPSPFWNCDRMHNLLCVDDLITYSGVCVRVCVINF